MNRKLSKPHYSVVTRLVAVLVCGLGLSTAWAPSVQAAGKVSVTVNGIGNLIVIGDGANNCVEVALLGTGHGTVNGCDSTLVNGGSSVSYSGVKYDFKFNMQGGNDTVIIAGEDGDTVLDDLEINTGTGNDTVEVHHFAVLGETHINTGSGNDLVIIDGVAARHSTQINTGSGIDCTVFGDLTPATATDCPTSP